MNQTQLKGKGESIYLFYSENKKNGCCKLFSSFCLISYVYFY